MRKILQTSCVLALAGLSFGCATRHVQVAPTNVALAGCQTQEGCVNTAGFELGDLVALDDSTGQGYMIMSVPVGAYDMSAPKLAGDSIEQFNAPFELGTGASVPTPVEHQAREALAAHTLLHVEGRSRLELRAPAKFALAHDEIARKMAQMQAENPGMRFFLVSAMTGAKAVYLTCDAPKQTVRVGNYQFHVWLDQENLQLRGMFDKSQFYSLTPLTIGKASDGRAVAKVAPEAPDNLPNYQFARDDWD